MPNSLERFSGMMNVKNVKKNPICKNLCWTSRSQDEKESQVRRQRYEYRLIINSLRTVLLNRWRSGKIHLLTACLKTVWSKGCWTTRLISESVTFWSELSLFCEESSVLYLLTDVPCKLLMNVTNVSPDVALQWRVTTLWWLGPPEDYPK